MCVLERETESGCTKSCKKDINRHIYIGIDQREKRERATDKGDKGKIVQFPLQEAAGAGAVTAPVARLLLQVRPEQRSQSVYQ